MLSEGEYVLGLEPGNTNPIGRLEAEKCGTLQSLHPGDVYTADLELEILDGAADLASIKREIEA